MINIPETLNVIKIGLGWDTRLDIDASIILLDANNNKIDYVSYSKLTSNDKAIHHLGDNLTGEGDGDDEVITVKLN